MEREKTKQGQESAKKPTQRATKQELLTHRITNTKTNLKKQPFIIHSFALAADNEETLEDMRQTATDFVGRATSGSAIIRALLRYAEQQPAGWIATQIQPLLEEEIQNGRLWGKQPKPGKR